MATLLHDLEEARPISTNEGTQERAKRRPSRVDQLVAVLVVAGMIALFGLVLWLASHSGTEPEIHYDLWLMP